MHHRRMVLDESTSSGGWLASVWGAAPDDVWAVGPNGTILHWDGSAWTGSAIGPDDEYIDLGPGSISIRQHGINALWGSSASDVWAVGDVGRILHWDGSAWSVIEDGESSAQLIGVWGTGPNDVWAVGADSNAVVLHWDGTKWFRREMGNLGIDVLTGVWGSGPNDVWIAGWNGRGVPWQQGAVARWDGTKWSQVHTSHGIYQRIWGSSANDVWIAASDFGQTFADHWNGSTWEEVPFAQQHPIQTFTGTGPNDIWVAGYGSGPQHFDGKDWSPPYKTDYTVSSLFAIDSSTVWAVGAAGVMRRWDGFTWSPQPPLVRRT